jgi:hypothetical protein
MDWIRLTESEAKPGVSDPANQKVPLETLVSGQIFSINTQSRKFELKSIELKASDRFPAGRILAAVVNEDGSIGSDMEMDYGLHQGMKVHVWGQAGIDAVTKPYSLFEAVKVKGSDARGVIVDVDKSKFPDCGLTVMWETPIDGSMVSEVHAHELESLGRLMAGHDKWGCGDQSLAEIRQIVMDLRGKHDKAYEDKTRDFIRQQVETALNERASDIQAMDLQQRQEVEQVCRDAIRQFAGEFKRITDACVMHVSGGEHDYEADKISDVLFNYADTIRNRVGLLTRDPGVATQASLEVMDVISDSALKSYFMTRHGVIRQENGKYSIYSQKGKRLGSFPSRKKALQRLRQIEYFKRHGESYENLEEGSES